MKNTFYLFVSLALFLGACSSDKQSTAKSTTENVTDKNTLLDRYAQELIASPANQDQIDHNIIVKKLMDEGKDFQKTASGIYYRIDPPGEGGSPDMNNTVVCHYRGTLLDGREFDSSYKRNKPLEFKLGQMVAGWQEAIPMLQKGGGGTFFIPSRLAYGPKGFPGTIIGANEVLKFEIELLDFK